MQIKIFVMSRKIVFITGATSGIGYASAIKFAQNGYNVIISGRRKGKLEDLRKKLVRDYGVEVMSLCFDVRDYEEMRLELEGLSDEWKGVDVLINNAGLALGLVPINEGEIDDYDTMIDTNVKGLLYCVKIVSGWMIKNCKGHIINIGSIAGDEVYANGGVYCATKYAVGAITKALRLELIRYGIKVSLVKPGATNTEFSIVRFKGDKDKADNVYKGYVPLSGEDVAEVIYYVASAPDNVNIAEVLVLPKSQASTTVFNRLE